MALLGKHLVRTCIGSWEHAGEPSDWATCLTWSDGERDGRLVEGSQSLRRCPATKGGTSRSQGSPRVKASCQMSSKIPRNWSALAPLLTESFVRTNKKYNLSTNMAMDLRTQQLKMLASYAPAVRGLGYIFSWLPHLVNVNHPCLKEYLSCSVDGGIYQPFFYLFQLKVYRKTPQFFNKY